VLGVLNGEGKRTDILLNDARVHDV